MKITSSEPKDNLGRSGKGIDYLSESQGQRMAKEIQKSRYAMGNVIMKDLFKIIREYEKLPYESYERKRPKHQPTNSYFYLARQIAKCTMRADALNSHVYPVGTEITATEWIPTSQVCSTDDSKLKEFLVDKTLSQICFTDEDESKGIIFDEFSTEEDESECVHKNINKQK